MLRRPMTLALTFAAAACAHAAPVIFWASDPVRPGETVVVIGDGFTDQPRVTVAGKPVPVIQPRDDSLKFVIPPDAKPGPIPFEIAVPPDKAKHTLNWPAVWWVQGDRGLAASPGGWVRAFGKNLGNDENRPVKITLDGPRRATLPAKGDDFAVTAELPGEWPEGQYTVRVDNGRGAASAPLEIRIGPPAHWPATRYDVTTFGASSDGQKDSSAAVEAALAAAEKAGGGIVYFPRGRYILTKPLVIPRLVTLKGQSRELVSLLWPDVDQPPAEQIRGTNSFAIEDLTFYCSNYTRFLVADDLQPDAGNIRLQRLTVRADRYRGHLEPQEVDRRLRTPGGNQTPLLVLGGENVEITDCDLYSSGMVFWLSRLRGALIADNTLTNGRWGWYCLSGSDGVIFEGNRIIGGDLMATGGGLNCLDGSTYSQHVYYARNTLSTMFGWDREAMTSDAGGGAYFGKVASAQGTVVTLAGDPNLQGRDWAGAGLYILDGKGMGQYRRVVSAAGRDVTVDAAWQVPPDATSTVTFCNYQGRCLFIGNDFTDAGVALQFYGNAIEHIASGNRSTRTAGFHNFGMIYSDGIQPNWYLQWLDNRILEGNVYRGDHDNWRLSGEAHIGVYALPPKPEWDTPLTLGTIVRRNTLENNAHIMLGCEWTGGSLDREGRYVRDVVVEGNTIGNSDLGIFAYRTIHGLVVRNNAWEKVRTPLGGPGMAEAYVTSAERETALRASLQSLLGTIGIDQDLRRWPDVASALQALTKAPDGSPEVYGLADAVTRAALSRIAQARPEGLPFSALASTLGLSVWIPYNSGIYPTLQNGVGGQTTIDLEITSSAAQGEALPISAGVELPQGWEGGKSDLAELKPGPPFRLSVPVTVPAGEFGQHFFPVTLVLHLGESALRLHANLEAGSGYVRGYMLLGPFPNKATDALDLTLLPPDDGTDLDGQYDGLKGKIGWQPWEDGDWLRFNELFPGDAPVCAYAVACLNCPQATPAELRVGGAASFALTLNGEPVWVINRPSAVGPGHDRKTVQLREGDSVLVFKLASKPVDWTWVFEVGPASDGPPLDGVTIVSPKEFRGRACFAPPPKPPASEVGEVRRPAGVSWKLAYADEFQRPNLGNRWRVGSGNWELRDGMAYANGVAFLCYAEKLPAPVRIEYDARVAGQVGGDLSACWLADPAQHTSGYLLGFGSNGNTISKLLIGGTQVTSAAAPLVQPGKWHHVIAQILADGRAQLIVDDQLSIDFPGPAPGEPRHPGLWSWNSDGVFRMVRIYTDAV
jgi:putative cofactor-binding repeat protein